MKHAVSVSLGSSSRDKKVTIALKGEEISVERIGTDGNIEKAQKLFTELDGQVDAFGVGGVDLYLRLGKREYPLHAALKLVKNVHQTPVVDGRGLKFTLERRVFELAAPLLNGKPHFYKAFIPMAVDRQGLAQAVTEVTDEVIIGDLMVALDIPIPISGLKSFRRVARVMFPFVSYFPMSLIFYGSGGTEYEPKYIRFWEESDLLAGDFLFMKKYMIEDLHGKTIITNTTTKENIELLRTRGAKMVITTTPRYEGRTFGTNMMEAALTAYAGKRRPLTNDELNKLIDELEFGPHVQILND
ncbi:MAG: hypothetical protein PVF83_17685 [Anaerolineales bacterium]|jgi:hypothetical protein